MFLDLISSFIYSIWTFVRWSIPSYWLYCL